jgi:hypothetical protein
MSALMTAQYIKNVYTIAIRFSSAPLLFIFGIFGIEPLNQKEEEESLSLLKHKKTGG